MVGNIVRSTARRDSLWIVFGTCNLRALSAFLCLSILASMVPARSAPAKDRPNAMVGAREALVPGKRPHIRQSVSARLQPYQAVGGLIGSKNCTGAIVLHPRIVVTAAHCVVGPTAAGPSPSLSFELWNQVAGGMRRFEATIRALGSNHHSGPQSVHDASQDWAVLLLNDTPRGVRPLDISDDALPELQSRRGRISLPTFAPDGDERTAIRVDPSCSIQDLQWEVLVHDCSAGAAGLGAPLLINDGQCTRIVGIYSGMLLDTDSDGRLKPIGNSAVGAWNFADPVRTLAHQLEDGEERNSADWKPLNACSFETAGLSRRLRAVVINAPTSPLFGRYP